MSERRAYKFRLKPTTAQAEALLRFAGARRFIYNWALERRKQSYKATGKSVSWAALSVELKALKAQPEYAWLKEIDFQLLQQALADCQRAFDNFFAKRARFPRFKSRKDGAQGFRIPQRVMIGESSVKVPKIGSIHLRQSREIIGRTKSATFKRDAGGHWYVSIIAEFELPDRPPVVISAETDVVGVDVGLKAFLATSEDGEIDAPRFFRRAERKLRRAQRSLSRRVKGSKRRAKAKLRVAKVHHQIRHQRADFIHRTTINLVRENPAISIEDLNVRGLARTKLSKSVLDAGWGMFFQQLEYKTRWSGRQLVKIDRYFPSSKLCSVCRYKNESLRLADREWDCPDCGAHHQRDLNAARNIRAEGYRILVAAGMSETQNARGADVRPAKAGSLR
jgi:putative transposase